MGVFEEPDQEGSMEKGAVLGAGRKVEQNSDRRLGEEHSDQGKL